MRAITNDMIKRGLSRDIGATEQRLGPENAGSAMSRLDPHLPKKGLSRFNRLGDVFPSAVWSRH